MYTNILLVTLLVVLCSESAQACTAARRAAWAAARATPSPTPNPTPMPTPMPTPKPTPAPTPMPTPPAAPDAPDVVPPIVKVVRQLEQVMSRNNCQRVAIATVTEDSLDEDSNFVGASAEAFQRESANLENEGYSDQCLQAEEYSYVCEFSVVSEIGLTTIYHPTGCGCAFTVSVVTPRVRDSEVANVVAVEAAYETKVTRFAVVVYDYVAQQVEVEIPEFSNMALSPETTALIEEQAAADPNGDFTAVTVGFAGIIKSFTDLPDQLNYNDPANSNYIPAIMFSIEQTYKTGAMFQVPCTLYMHTAPNAYMSQCQPYRPTDAFVYSKRHSLESKDVENEDDVAWFREFYLFPKQESTCGSGVSQSEPKSRYITSIYSDSLCTADSGELSFDREFESTFTQADVVVGGWQWTRSFDIEGADTRVVFGVPHSFASLTAIWCLGYSQITWTSKHSFAPSSFATDNNVCTVLDFTNVASEVQSEKYGESHASYPVSATTVACTPIFTDCAKDATLLGFKNNDPRDFEKRTDSVLMTGPRRLFCTEHSQEGADYAIFDTLTFRGVTAGEALAKRNWDDSAHPEPHQIHMMYSDDHNGLINSRHVPHLVAQFNEVRRKREEEEIVLDPISAPHRDNFALNTAAGSVDIAGSDSAPAGDHPLRSFPETYAAPLTLDPLQSESEEEPLVYDGELVTGVPPSFCVEGDLGCTCRDSSAVRGPCDAPYECNTLQYCARPACPVGEAGCAAHSDNTCEAFLMVDEQGMCVYAPSCTAGDTGCGCSADDTCTNSDASCLDSVCILSGDGLCAEGNDGCPCVSSDASCNSEEASCDASSGLCLFQSCARGTAGCLCNTVGQLCPDGFICGDSGNCIESTCVPGDAGCGCATDKQCNLIGFTCVELTRDGTENMCVGEDLCGEDQTERCEAECGPGNVAVCSQCSYSQPICRDVTVQYCNPDSYLYGVELCSGDDSDTTSASTVVMSCAVALFAIVASIVA